MSAPIRWHRGQRKPWGSTPRINWDHPLTKGLISYAYDTGSGPVDLVSGGQRTLLSTANPPLSGQFSSKWGSGLRSGAGSGVVGVCTLPANAAVRAVCAAAPYSYSCGFTTTANPTFTGQGARIYSTCKSASANTHLLVGLASPGQTDIWFQFGGWEAHSSAAGAIRLNEFQTGTGVCISNTSVQGYVDGAIVFNDTVTQATQAADATLLITFQGGRATNSQIVPTIIHYGAIWEKRALTAAEARLLHDDPYCFLIYPEDEIFGCYVGALADITGDLAVTEATDVALFAGDAKIVGTFNLVDTRDVVSINGTVVNATTGVLAANEASIGLSNNTFVENSAVNTLVGTLTVAGLDTASFSGTVTGVAGTLTVTEAQDQAAFFSNPNIASGILAANEAGILLSNHTFPENSATNTVIGALTVVGVDGAAFSGAIGAGATLEATEAPDAAAFNGTVFNVITAVLLTTEAPDSALFGGTVFDTILAQLLATEVQDSASLSGSLFNPPAGQFAVTEPPDVAAFTGSVTGIVVQFALTEPVDFAAFSGTATQIPLTGILNAIERADSAYFVEEGPDEADFDNWKFGYRFDRSLTSRFPWQAGFPSRPH